MKKLMFLLLFAAPAFAATSIRPLSLIPQLSQPRLQEIVNQNFDTSSYREVGVQAVLNGRQRIDHLLLHLHFKNTHRLALAAIFVDSAMNVTRVVRDYRMTAQDFKAQPNSGAAGVCPDPTVQFIAFAPNTDSTEQGVTVAVAQAATSAGLKVVQLLESNATRANYLNYMACPNLKGNFYDGDSNPDEFVTVDGVISSSDMAAFNFNLKVTNIWVACEAFNDPMKSMLLTTAQSQKYAAGVNDLEVGPSDNAAKCAMIAAIGGQPMTAAFQSCYKQYDDSSDQWGFDGNGSDTFGQ
jgi:hypothetical protein